MGIQDLQHFLESNAFEGGSVSVDLLRIARNASQRQNQLNNRNKRFNIGNKLKLVLDAECCLDRLYGGYFSDWACGGQWNRTVQFLSLLIHAIESGNIDLAVVFNGASEPQRLSDWIAEQNKLRQRMNLVLKHINMKGTPPPKVWWCPPTCLRTVLRMALRHLNTQVLCSMDDHRQEVIAYCRENNYHGVVADDAEYAAFDPPRYFSSENLKLTYKGSLETKEFMIGEMAKHLSLTRDHLCIVAALLGNYLLPESELVDIYASKMKLQFGSQSGRPSSEQIVKAVSEYVKMLPPLSNMDAVICRIFDRLDDKRAPALRQSIQYYVNGTSEGFLNYRTATTRRADNLNKKKGTHTVTNHSGSTKSEENDLDTSGFASETTEREQKSLEDYKLATANAIIHTNPEIVIESDMENLSISSNSLKSPHTTDSQRTENEILNLNNLNSNNSVNGSTSVSCGSSVNPSPRHLGPSRGLNERPKVSVEVMRTATERHQKGLMSPLIYHVLIGGEVRLPCIMEDSEHREFPPSHQIFKPIRLRVYGVLFNLHHLQYMANKNQEKNSQEKTSNPLELFVKEWTWSKTNPYTKSEQVKAEQLGWAVPTIQRLWFGSTVDDKRRRLRAFLTCLNSDSGLMLNPSYVPQHMLMLACVLRYIMSCSSNVEKKRSCILRKQELDAFIAHAFAPELMNSQYLQELILPLVTARGVQLAALFMHGVEMTLLANDACGAPIPWLMSCPWLYFDGKLFHYTLARSAVVKNLLELCENHIDRVVKVERMRKAILEGLDYQFAKQPLPSLAGVLRPGMPPPNCLPPLALPSTRGPASLARRAPVPSRGGQLQVAGVVVGQWGANYGLTYRNNQSTSPLIGGGRGLISQSVSRGGANNNNSNRISWPTNNRNKNVGRGGNRNNRGHMSERGESNRNRRKGNRNSNEGAGGHSRGITVQLPTGESVTAAEYKNIERRDASADTTAPNNSTEHKGQGDGPTVDNANSATPQATAPTAATAN